MTSIVEIDEFVHEHMMLTAKKCLKQMQFSQCTSYHVLSSVRADKDVQGAIRLESIVDGTTDEERAQYFNQALWNLEKAKESQSEIIRSEKDIEELFKRCVVVVQEEPQEELGLSLGRYRRKLASVHGRDKFRERKNEGIFPQWRQKVKDLGERISRSVSLFQRATTKAEQIEKEEREKLERKVEELRLSRALKAAEEEEKAKAIKAAQEAEEKRKQEEEARRAASQLLRPLDPEEGQIAKEAIFGIGPKQEVVAKFGTDTIRRESMHRLQDGVWLNDEVIHYFLLVLSKRDEELSGQDSARPRSHFFKSFFMTKLLNEGHSDPAKDGVYEYKNVKRWSKKVPGKDLFKLDKIIFPINQGNVHWSCAVAHITKKRIQMYDSMGSSGNLYLTAILNYLKDEHEAKRGTPLPDVDNWELVGTTKDTPRQMNGYDCGVFTCMFADFVSTDRPLLFNQEHITQCRQRIAVSIMKGKALL